GLPAFVDDAVDAGVDGIIVPDLPPDEASDLIRLSKKAGLDTIFLLAPTSTEDRIKKVAQSSRGFLYYVSMTGITGSGLHLDGSMGMHLSEIRRHTEAPVSVGFGVSSPEEAAAVAKMADGVIIGSAIVRKFREAPEQLKDFLTDLRRSIR
ncbi:MAG TPA: tryptophan synthase subunit alpha, partial [Thermodesulfovibrionales bacterium]|nr:tryptophan synthase subunit alpha [Thermodesulfovibrionales bacterium]